MFDFKYQAKICAFVELTLNSIILSLVALGSFVLLFSPGEMEEEFDKNPSLHVFRHADTFTKFLYMVPSFAYLSAEIWLGVFLLKAAEKLDYKKLRLWFVISLTLAIILGVLAIPSILTTSFSGITLVFVFCNGIFTAYSLWVVHNLRLLIKTNAISVGNRNNSNIQPPPAYTASFTNANYDFTDHQNENKEFMQI